MGTAFAFRNRTYGIFLSNELNDSIVPMFFGMWTTGFVAEFCWALLTLMPDWQVALVGLQNI